MSDIWTPGYNPPQVSYEATLAMLEELVEDGYTPLVARGQELLHSAQESLGEYIDRLGFQLNGLSDAGPWPDIMVKIGSAIAMCAYRETGYFQIVDEEIFNVGCLLATIDGIPDTFFTSAQADKSLQTLLGNVLSLPDFRDEEGGFQQIMTIGAGCTRYFMQQALAA